LIRHLLPRYPVYWVNTIGTRSPEFSLDTLRRGVEKLKGWIRRTPSSAQVPNLRVLNPKMWPWFNRGFDRSLNRLLLSRQLAPLVRSLPMSPIAVTTLPLLSDMISVLPVRRWVYYCVDDFGEWPGLAQTALRRMEERLIRNADSLIAVSETLQDKLARWGRKSLLLTHGIEPDFWKSSGSGEASPALQGLKQPLVVFWGVIDRRMDVSFVQQLSTEMKDGTIVLVGPESQPDPALYAVPRVVHVPALPYDHLPQLAAAAAVLIMPYADLPVTRAMQPLKLKEYLATNRPVVARDLPANRTWSDCLDLADTPTEFSRLVRLRLEKGLSESQRVARGRLAGETWADKARCFEHWCLQP
jgi:glycosyltransferase involved in cell wall biosynthesis